MVLGQVWSTLGFGAERAWFLISEIKRERGGGAAGALSPRC